MPSIEMQPSSIGRSPVERAQQRGLARTVRPEHREKLAVGHRELDVERERADRDPDGGVDAHSAESQRSRRLRSTSSETATSTRLNTIAASEFAPSNVV